MFCYTKGVSFVQQNMSQKSPVSLSNPIKTNIFHQEIHINYNQTKTVCSVFDFNVFPLFKQKE